MALLEVKVNKDIRDYRQDIFFGMNMRQISFTAVAVAVGVGVYFGFRDLFPDNVVFFICAVFAAPFILGGFWEYNKMPLEEVILVWWRSKNIPKELPYVADNVYKNMMEEKDKESKEEKKDANKHSSKNRKRKQESSVLEEA